MKIYGYTEIFRTEEVIVFDLQETSLPTHVIIEHELKGFGEYHLPLDPLRQPFQVEDIQTRRRGRRKKENQSSINLILDGKKIELKGFVYAPTYSQLVQFLLDHMQPRAKQEDHFENWWFQNRNRTITDDLYTEAESYLIKELE